MAAPIIPGHRQPRDLVAASLVATGLAVLAGCGKGGSSSQRPPPASADAAPVARPAPADAGSTPRYRVFATAAEALAEVVGPDTRVLGVGELHERTGAAPVESAISRFRGLFEAGLAARTSDLVVEVWARDACGETSAKTSHEVQQMTQRPAATENEIVSLMKAAKQRGVQNHVLELHCADYDSILDDKKEVDYEKLLLLVTRKLAEVTRAAVELRSRQPPPAPRRLVVVYGGALHNNRYPDAALADMSYVPQVSNALGAAAGYVELDLFVPEYAQGDQILAAEPWYPLLDQAGPDHVVLIDRGPGSYVLLLARGVARPAPPK